MKKPVPERHPLRKLFNELTVRNFMDNIGLADPEIIKYISDLLTDFIYSDNLYKIRNSKGKKLNDIGEMLLESEEAKNILKDTRTERDIRKHIGDYTLFFAGMFPEYLKQRKKGLGMDYIIDYIQTGKESYCFVADSSMGTYAQERELFLKLSDNFDYCMIGLNFVKTDLDRLKNPCFHHAKRIIES